MKDLCHQKILKITKKIMLKEMLNQNKIINTNNNLMMIDH